MQFQKTTLPNGLRVLTSPMPSFESATVLVLVGAGSRYETRENNGISHFLEHMAFKGTHKRPSAMDIATLIDGMGGEFNAFTGKETTGYYIKSSSNHIDVCLDVLSDMLQRSKLAQEEIEKERGVILEEINLYEDTPMRKIGDIYERLLYGDTPMGWDIAGEKDIIRSIARKDFLSYMGTLYSAHNIAVVIAGGIDVDKAVEFTEKYFGGMQTFGAKTFEPIVEAQEKPSLLIKKKATEQVHIAVGVRTVPQTHKDRYALSVLSAILGGGMSSRLFNEVREKRGLAYYVRTNTEHYKDCGTLVSFAGVDPKKAKDAVAVIINEYQKVAQSGDIKNEELNKAKEFIKGHLVLELEDSQSVAMFYGSQELLEDKVDNPDDVIEKIKKVTLEQVSAVAKKYLTEKSLNVAVIGNIDDRQSFEKVLI